MSCCNNCLKETCSCNQQAVGCNTDMCEIKLDAKCVFYNSTSDLNIEPLDCINVPANTNLQIILQEIDDKICGILNSDDIFSKVSANDTTTNFLNSKLVGSDCIATTILNPLGDEQLEFSIIVDPDGSNLISCTPTGLLALAPTLELKITADDTCPSETLDAKFENPITDLVGMPGYGNHCGGIVVHGIPSPSVVSTLITQITIGGITYVNPSSTDPINNCEELVSVFNTIFEDNSLPYVASSTGSSVLTSNQTLCSVCISGIPSGDVVDVDGATDNGGGPVPFTVNFPYDADSLNPKYFKTVYKKIEDDAGCETISFYAYDETADDKPGCTDLLSGDITLLNYASAANFPTLYLDIAKPVQPGVFYSVDIEEIPSNTKLVTDFVIKGDNTAFIPLVNHNSVDDIQVTIKRDCGCCADSISNSVVKTRVAIPQPTIGTGCVTDWIDINSGSLLNGWLSDGLQYRGQGDHVEFRGSIYKLAASYNSTVPLGGYSIFERKFEDLFDAAALIGCVSVGRSTNYGLKEQRTQRNGVYSYSSVFKTDHHIDEASLYLESSGATFRLAIEITGSLMDPNNGPLGIATVTFGPRISFEGVKLWL